MLDHLQEITRLQRCIANLVSVLALPALCQRRDVAMVLRTVVEVLSSTLDLDVAYVRSPDTPEVQLTRQCTGKLGALLDGFWGADPRSWPGQARIQLDGIEHTAVTMQLGLQGELGAIVACVRRASFPVQTEQVLLSVVANQAVLLIQELRRAGEQKRLAEELVHCVSERTTELMHAGESLRREYMQRTLVEARLREEERELQRSEALLAETQRISRTGSFLWRVAKGQITWSSESYRIFELDRAAPPTLLLIESRVHPEDRPLLREQVERTRRGDDNIRFGLRLQLPSGATAFIQVVARRDLGPDGGFEYIGSIQDLTERRRSEEVLAEARAALARATRITSLGVLSASIAHEVNQPLSGIVINSAACLRLLAAEPPKLEAARETVRHTKRDGERAAAVIARLRELFGAGETRFAPVDLNEVATEVVGLSQAEIEGARVTVRLELAEDLPLVLGDRVQLQQVVANLLSNATAAMSGIDGHPRQLCIRTEQADVGVQLTLRDTGVGLDMMNIERLFEAFYTTKRAGMGIGLAISRSIVESHGGKIWAAAPKAGPGACFAFSIPRLRARHDSSAHP